uniref:mRNA export factor GLE1 n=1 Tax=Anthurium amnicola TaxID=1678845 RepID=A0A1D1XNS0_9ARAE
MGFAKLELRVPRSSTWGKVLAEPDPYWTLDSLISELDSFQIKSPLPPPSSPPTLGTPDCRPRDGAGEDERTGVSAVRPFTMCISDDDDAEDSEGDSEESSDQSLMTGTRFSCPEADFDSEGSDYELDLEEPQIHLMDKTSLDESFLFELEREHQLKVKEEIRKKASALEAELRNENEKSFSAVARLEKHMEARREMDRRLDKQYQRKLAEALDCHLSIVQRDHEQRSQIVERRIKDDAALEEAKKKEKALHEEKVRQAKAEAEARQEAARIEEEKQKAVLEAASVSLAEHQGKDEGTSSKTILGEATWKQSEPNMAINQESPATREVAVPSTHTGVVFKAADSALKAAAERLAKYDQGSELYDKLVSSSDKDFDNYQRQIARWIRQLTGTVENVRTKSSELSNIMKDPRCPYPVSLMIFAKKILNLCENPGASFDGIAFAVGHVIVRVTAQVPAAMDFVLAEFHRSCIYTVPKFLQSFKVTNRANEYQKLIGYREENGKIESTDSYLDRVESYMKLYAALVQTEIGDIRNPHGIKEGWAWLARFLNMLPANKFTAVALEAFLKMAGFALFQKYRAQFNKMLNIISNKFLPALKAKGNADVYMIISKLETYLEKKLYLKEPNGRRLEVSLSSRLHMA